MRKIIEFISEIGDGGAETLIKDYAILFDKKKYDIQIVTLVPNYTSANSRLLKENDIHVMTIYPWRGITQKVFSRLFAKYYSKNRLKKIIKDYKPDCIHIHLEWLHLFAEISDSLKGITLFYTCHNEPSHIFEKYKEEFDACKYLIENNNIRLIALHEKMRLELNELFHIDNTVIIHNGINFDRFLSVPVIKEEKRKEIGIPPEAYVLGHVGRFSYQKNHEFLIKVFSKVLELNNHAHLLLVGIGPLMETVKKQIEELNLTGKVTILSNRSDIPELMRAMDVFVFPSRFEGLSVTMIEAQVSGLPCIVTDQINPETFCTNHIASLSLDCSLDEWANLVINPQCNIPKWENIENYNIRNGIEKLGRLYQKYSEKVKDVILWQKIQELRIRSEILLVA